MYRLCRLFFRSYHKFGYSVVESSICNDRVKCHVEIDDNAVIIKNKISQCNCKYSEDIVKNISKSIMGKPFKMVFHIRPVKIAEECNIPKTNFHCINFMLDAAKLAIIRAHQS